MSTIMLATISHSKAVNGSNGASINRTLCSRQYPTRCVTVIGSAGSLISDLDAGLGDLGSRGGFLPGHMGRSDGLGLRLRKDFSC